MHRMQPDRWIEGEGCSDLSWVRTGASPIDDDWISILKAKARDHTLLSGPGQRKPRQHPPKNAVLKRSLRRVINRANAVGCAWYQGRCFTPQQLPAAKHPTIPQSHIPKHARPVQRFAPRHRLQLGHYNVGGLAQDRLMEIKLWASAAELDLLILTETRWSFDSEWQDPEWFHIHTGTTEDRADGILFLIRTAFSHKTRSILHRYFNPLVFWYQWEYLLTSKDFFFAGYLRLAM